MRLTPPRRASSGVYDNEELSCDAWRLIVLFGSSKKKKNNVQSILKESPASNTRHDLNDRICSPEYSIKNRMKKFQLVQKL